MSPPRFYCRELSEGVVTLSESESRHALLSRRLSPGASVELFDGRGNLARGRLCSASTPATGSRRRARAASVAVEELVHHHSPQRRLTLITAGCKGARLDWLVEKCTELGVTGVVLAEFEHSVVHVGQGHVEKLRRTAIEASKQCGRLWLPAVEAGATLAEAVSEQAEALLLVGDRSNEAVAPAVVFTEHNQPPKVCGVIGPEGGLSAGELEMLRSSGARPVRLSEQVLRVETAGVALASLWACAGPARK